tara:strand:- start:4566 stop:5432 length:867 start_codon:yes stop_codon:yes gene_type:complete
LKKILITGGSGYIASHVADILSNNGHKVFIFDKIKSKYLSKRQIMIKGDITDEKKILKFTKNIDAVYHFAAVADLYEANKYPNKTIKTNILGTLNVLEACKINKIKKIILASSIYALSEQGRFYSTSKLCSEMLVENYSKKYNFKFVTLRFGSIYGDRANKFNTISNFILEGIKTKKIIRKSDGSEERNYIHVLDASKLCVEVLKSKYSGGYFNVFGPKKMKLKNLLIIIKNNLGNVKLYFEKKSSMIYNYKKSPFSYRLRKGKNLKLKKYENLELSIKEMIRREKKI